MSCRPIETSTPNQRPKLAKILPRSASGMTGMAIRQMASLVELVSLVESNNDQSKHQGHDDWFKNQWMLLTKQPA
ncbi:unnamed protein product [Phytophthora fragariaefolia]|uniref:Unnamed protein product n=1 Tax=Phytophthora fragariaefolia TaxID=1490495 RepID=A0A9W7D685_9STRA|nr:unnamed protein product [Phytophthora fragariaefolia]